MTNEVYGWRDAHDSDYYHFGVFVISGAEQKTLALLFGLRPTRAVSLAYVMAAPGHEQMAIRLRRHFETTVEAVEEFMQRFAKRKERSHD